MYRSDDGGNTWEKQSDDANILQRAWYFSKIFADTKNENIVYALNVNMYRSMDGGKTFKSINTPHGDHHDLWIDPEDANRMIVADDGGAQVSFDAGANWSTYENQPTGQYYRVSTDTHFPYRILAAQQDNSTVRILSASDGGQITASDWSPTAGAESGYVVADPLNPDIVYGGNYGGYLSRYDHKTGENRAISVYPDNPMGAGVNTMKYRFQWNFPIFFSPHNPKRLYVGAQHLFVTENEGQSWEMISPDLTTNDSAKQVSSGGPITQDNTSVEYYCTIFSALESPYEKDLLWTGSDDGRVNVSKDGGKNWADVTPPAAGKWMMWNCIDADPFKKGAAYIVGTKYKLDDFKPYIFRTKNYGQTWERMIDENKVKGYALCMIQDPVEPNLIFAGTEHGLWISFDNGSSFQQWKNDYPSVSTYDMAIQEREADLVVATFGRAIYIFDDIKAFRKAAANNGNVFPKRLTVFQAPAAYQANYRPETGYDWSKWGLYEGENRNNGASYSYFIKPADSSKKSKVDSATVKIYDERNEIIRTLKFKVDTGFNRAYWGFEMKGIRRPNSPKPKADAQEPRGFSVFPGTYKLVMSLGKEMDSTNIVVNADPNVPVNRTIYDAKMGMMDRLNKSTERLTEITDRLSEAEETISKVEAQLKNEEGKEIDSLRKVGKAMGDSIKSIRNFIFGKPQEKQGYGTIYQLTVNGKLDEARGEVLSKAKIPDQQEMRMATEAESLVSEAVQKTNAFFNNKWQDYKTLVEKTQINLFKPYKLVE